jgi:hypothetical protein
MAAIISSFICRALKLRNESQPKSKPHFTSLRPVIDRQRSGTMRLSFASWSLMGRAFHIGRGSVVKPLMDVSRPTCGDLVLTCAGDSRYLHGSHHSLKTRTKPCLESPDAKPLLLHWFCVAFEINVGLLCCGICDRWLGLCLCQIHGNRRLKLCR